MKTVYFPHFHDFGGKFWEFWKIVNFRNFGKYRKNCATKIHVLKKAKTVRKQCMKANLTK